MSHTKPLLMPGEVENLRRMSTADPGGEVVLFQSVCLCSHTFLGPFDVWCFCVATNHSHLGIHLLGQRVPRSLKKLNKTKLNRNNATTTRAIGLSIVFPLFCLNYGLICNYYYPSISYSLTKFKMHWTTYLCSSSRASNGPVWLSGLQCVRNVVSLGTWLHVTRRDPSMIFTRFLLVAHIPCAQPLSSSENITSKCFFFLPLCNFSENIGDPELHHQCRQSQPEWLCVSPYHPEVNILQTPSPEASGHHHYNFTPKCFLTIHRGKQKNWNGVE